MEIQGKIKLIGETKTFGEKDFRKRELVITTEEQYPQHILVEFVQDKCELLEKFSIDAQVNVSINLRGREWVNKEGETKYFNSIQGWRIEEVNNQSLSNVPNPPTESNMETTNNLNKSDEKEDDLPF